MVASEVLQKLSTANPRLHRGQLQRTMTDPNGRHVKNSRSALGCNYVFTPRTLQDILKEGHYLVNSYRLQERIWKTSMEQYWSLVEQIERLEAPGKRRGLRKKASQLKTTITVAVEAQMAIYLRLGEVEIEIQSARARNYAHLQAMHFPSEWSSPVQTLASLSTPSTLNMSSISLSTCTTPLDATSPVFVPKRELPELQTPSEPRLWAETNGPVAGLTTVEEAGEDLSSNHGLQYAYCRPDKPQETSLVLWAGSTEEVQLGRSPSLPNLQYFWPAE